MLRSALTSLAFGLLLVATSAKAQTLELAWHAPSACPTEAQIRSRVSRLLAQSEWHDPISATARIEPQGPPDRPAHYVMHLEIDALGRRAVRDLRAEDCDSLAEAAVWLMSLSVDPNLPPPAAATEQTASTTGTSTPRDDSAPPAAQSQAADAQPAKPTNAKTPTATTGAKAQPDPDESTAAGRTGARLHYRIGVLTGLFAGGMAGAAGSLGGELGVDIDRVGVSLDILHHFARSSTLSVPGATAKFTSQELSANACYVWGAGFRAGPCAQLSVLRSEGEAGGLGGGTTAAFVWATAGAGLSLRWLVRSPLELGLDGRLWVPVTARPRFEIAGIGHVGEASSFGGQVRLGVSLRLP